MSGSYAERMRKREELRKLQKSQLVKLGQKYCKPNPYDFLTRSPVSEWSESLIKEKLEESPSLSLDEIEAFQKPQPKPQAEKPIEPLSSELIKWTWKYEREVDELIRDFSIIPKADMKESDIELQLEQALRREIPDIEITHQRINKRGRGDIVVGKHIIIELKIIQGLPVLRDLKGQLQDYQKVYPRLFVVLYDPFGKIQPANLQEFKDDLRQMRIKNCTVYRKPDR